MLCITAIQSCLAHIYILGNLKIISLYFISWYVNLSASSCQEENHQNKEKKKQNNKPSYKNEKDPSTSI